MSSVDIDLDTVIKFCQDFQKDYLDVLLNSAQKLKTSAGSATATLGNTPMATNSGDKLERVADAIIRAVQVGEDRVLELEKKAQYEKEEKRRIEERCR